MDLAQLLPEIAGELPAMPNRWGPGLLFAFSGLDGRTDYEHGWDLHSGKDLAHWLDPWHPGHGFRLQLPDEETAVLVTGDTLITSSGCIISWMHKQAISIHLSEAASIDIFGPNLADFANLLQFDEQCIALHQHGQQAGIGIGTDRDEAECFAERAADCDTTLIATERLRSYTALPHLADTAKAELLAKCFSVMRVNAHGPQGQYDCRWSTPDRWPHKHCWLWDSVFHSLGIHAMDPLAAWDYLRAVLLSQRDDGMIPHMSRPDGRCSSITQPPILAWGVLENYKDSGDTDALRWAYPRLCAYLQWNLQHRDSNNNHLLEWHIEANERCRSGESGMDNSPRFDAALLMDAVDFSVFQAQDCAALARIAYVLDDLDGKEQWEKQAKQISTAIHEHLWHADSQTYRDRLPDGSWCPVSAVSGLLPLLLTDLPKDRKAALLASITDPQGFGTPVPLPSVRRDDPAFSTDMWRGASWMNMNWFVIQGLRRQGCDEAARHLTQHSINTVQDWYQAHAVTYEFYDADGQTPPDACERKGPSRPDKMDSIKDYHWTAALTFLLLIEDADA